MNKIILIGNLTRDPELKTTSSGVSVCEFTIAVNDRRNQQNVQGSAQFFRISAWRQLGENCQRYLSKGRKVYVSGHLSARTYQVSTGDTRVSLEVTADEVEFLSSRDDGASAAPSYNAPMPPQPSEMMTVETDDLPF